jgi:hypothetical protein
VTNLANVPYAGPKAGGTIDPNPDEGTNVDLSPLANQ